MSENGNGNGTPKYFAMLRMEAIEHKIGLGNPVNRIFYTVIRCSICYPHQKPFAVRPEVNGRFEEFVAQLHDRIIKQRPVTKDDIREERAATDHRGEPVPLSWRELEQIAGVWHSGAIKALAKLRADGVIANEHPFRLIEVPTVVPLFEPIGVSGHCAGPENFDNSFVINQRLKKLQNFLGVSLHCAVTSDEPAQKTTVQFLEELCAVRRDAEKEARDKIRAAIAERGAVTGIFIERASKSSKTRENTPPTPSSADADKGNGVNPTAVEQGRDTLPLDFRALLFAAEQAGLTFADGQIDSLGRLWRSLSEGDRLAAIEGIKDRLTTGYYPAYATTLKRYLKEKLWTEQLRAVAAAGTGPAARKAAARAEFIERTKQDLEEMHSLPEEADDVR